MVEPVTIATLITIIATFILNIYQTVKSREFHSECCGAKVDYKSEHQDVQPRGSTDSGQTAPIINITIDNEGKSHEEKNHDKAHKRKSK